MPKVKPLVGSGRRQPWKLPSVGHLTGLSLSNQSISLPPETALEHRGGGFFVLQNRETRGIHASFAFVVLFALVNLTNKPHSLSYTPYPFLTYSAALCQQSNRLKICRGYFVFLSVYIYLRDTRPPPYPSTSLWPLVSAFIIVSFYVNSLYLYCKIDSDCQICYFTPTRSSYHVVELREQAHWRRPGEQRRPRRPRSVL